MPDFLLQIDQSLFFWINQGWANPILDWFMPVITFKENGFPLWIAVYVLLLWKGGKKGRIAALLIIPVIALSDQMAASVIKPWVERMRPCAAMLNVRMLIGLKTSYSFPSAHASNIFAAATFFSVFYPKGRMVYFTLAVLVGLSRIYVGVHYPFDVIGGAILGALCAWTVIWFYRGSETIIAKIRQVPPHPVV